MHFVSSSSVNQYFIEIRKRKVFEILEHLLYSLSAEHEISTAH